MKIIVWVTILVVLAAISISITALVKSHKTTDKYERYDSKAQDKMTAFNVYLKQKLNLSLQANIKDKGQWDDATTGWVDSNQFGIGIHIKNTPLNTGPVSQWATFCGAYNVKSSICTDVKTEPNFYFGSGTKPVTATMVAAQLYKLWRQNNPNGDVNEFVTWYAGPKGQRGAPPAVTYKDIYDMTKGFATSNFTQTVTRNSNTQSPGTNPISITQRLQDWIFCCPTNGLIKSCPGDTSLFCNNSCEKLCPIPLDPTYGGKCESPFCPDDICQWAWKNKDGTTALKDPDALAFRQGNYCDCKVVPPSSYQDIIQNLSIFEVSMMRSGIPDSDSIWGIDTAAQLASRTHSIGPIEFVGEIIGFDWIPGWKKVNGTYTPNTLALDTSNWNEPSNYPAAQYSSSAFTFLGTLLWLLTNTKGRKKWNQVDLNALLPPKLQTLLNFAGTSGNGGQKYMNVDANGQQYYSYEKTVSYGGVSHSGITADSPIDTTQTGLEQTQESQTKSNVYNRYLHGATIPIAFADWDASSGLSCGNIWTKCSAMAEVYMNILSPTAANPLMGDAQEVYCNNLTNYAGPNSVELDKNRIRAPWCLGANAWSQGYTYNCGVMGPDWFYLYDNPNSNTKYGVIPCFGHLGSTYGYCSCNLYFPGGTLKAYEPLKNNTAAYSSPNWSTEFKFAGGFEFTISCVQNSCTSESQGPIQQFITEVLKDPFKWDE
jgi:hypothetical protein